MSLKLKIILFFQPTNKTVAKNKVNIANKYSQTDLSNVIFKYFVSGFTYNLKQTKNNINDKTSKLN